MKPTTLIALLATAIVISVVVRVRTDNLSGGVESRVADRDTDLGAETRIGIGRVATRPATSWPSASGSSAPPAQSPTNPEAQRIISELIAEGAAKEHAEHVWKLINEAAAEQRKNRPPMPGTRADIDTNRWPLFSEP